MLNHIPAGIDPQNPSYQRQIEDAQDGYRMDAADEYAAFVEAIASEVQNILTEYEDVSRIDVSTEITSNRYGVGSFVIGLPEEAPALPELVISLVEPFYGSDFIELRSEGQDVSPDYGLSDEYMYVFHYGG